MAPADALSLRQIHPVGCGSGQCEPREEAPWLGSCRGRCVVLPWVLPSMGGMMWDSKHQNVADNIGLCGLW